MAKAKLVPAKVEVVREAGVTLELTMEEAEAIRSLAGQIYLNDGIRTLLSETYHVLDVVLPGSSKYRVVKMIDTSILLVEK